MCKGGSGLEKDIYKLLASQSKKEMATGEIELRHSAQICCLCCDTVFQSREPPIWPQFFISNCCRYGHEQAAML